MSDADKWNAARIPKPGRHPFTPLGSNTELSNKCAICIHSPAHEVHSGAQVINLDQFRKKTS